MPTLLDWKNDWCLFIVHLALEKILKAIFVDRNDNNVPPKVHNLVRLAELSMIELGENQKLFKVSLFHLQTLTFVSFSGELGFVGKFAPLDIVW